MTAERRGAAAEPSLPLISFLSALTVMTKSFPAMANEKVINLQSPPMPSENDFAVVRVSTKTARAASAGRVLLKYGLPAALLTSPLVTFAAELPRAAAVVALASVAQGRRRADVTIDAASSQARQVAEWVAESGDNAGLPYIIVDKPNARLFLFDSHGVSRISTAVLLGSARGDVSPPGIGERPLADIAPAERITPAGRFVAAPGKNLAGQDILWVDYGAAISLHRATDKKPGLTAKSRTERLATPSMQDKRVTHGCINVSAKFYDDYILPTFRTTTGIVYVLPDTRRLSDVFHIRDDMKVASRNPSIAVGG